MAMSDADSESSDPASADHVRRLTSILQPNGLGLLKGFKAAGKEAYLHWRGAEVCAILDGCNETRQQTADDNGRTPPLKT